MKAAQNLQELHELFLRSAGICTDTRKLEKGHVFVALKGEHFDGNRYVQQALDKGCMLAITEDASLAGDDRVFHTPDALKLLQDLARYHRQALSPRVIGITGSNGKTTTKELSAAILGRKYSVLSTRGNLNNHIGVPLTLLSLKDEEVAVVEMGANHAGEIRLLASIALPELGIITNVGKAHLEGFGSLEGVLEAKGELYEQLTMTGGVALVDGHDRLLLEKAERSGTTCLRVGPGGDIPVDVQLKGQDPWLRVELIVAGNSFPVETRLVGAYNLQNIRLAAALGHFMEVEPAQIAEALASYEPQNQRSQLVRGRRNTLILDAYNANPTSMRESISAFVEQGGMPGMLILGDMAELGQDSMAEHRSLVAWLMGLDMEEVILIGPIFHSCSEPSGSLRVFKDRNEAEGYLRRHTPEGRMILLKGSRVMELESLSDLLLGKED